MPYVSPLNSGTQPPAEVAAAHIARKILALGSIDLAVDATCKEITRAHNGSEYGAEILEAVQKRAEGLKTTPGILIPGIAPVNAGAQAIPFESAQAQLIEAMRRVWRENARAVALLTAGHGKTTEIIKAAIRDMPQWQPLHDFENLDAPGLVRARGLDVFVPTHDLAEETAAKLAEGGVSVAVIYGRDYVEFGADAPLCKRHKEFAKLRKNDVSAGGQTLCAARSKGKDIRCPHFAECAYADQFRTIRQTMPQVIIRVHNALYMEPSLLESEALDWRKSPVIVIDENPQGAALETDTTGWKPSYLQKLADAHASGAIMADLLCALAKGEKLTDALRGRAFEVQMLLQALREMPVLPSLGPADTDADIRGALGQAVPKDAPRAALEALARALEGDLPFNGIWFSKKRGRVMAAALRPMVRGATGALLVLDATGVPGLYQALIPNVEIFEARAPRNVMIFQFYTESWGASFIKGEDSGSGLNDEALPAKVAAVRFGITMAERIFPKVAAIMPKVLHEQFPDREHTGHFGDIRGLNGMEDCDAMLVFGRPLPPPGAVEALARAFYPHAELNLTGEYRKELRGFNGRCEGFGLADVVHADPRVQSVIESIEHAEVEQALDRLRLVDRNLYHCNPPKVVFLFNQTPMRFGVNILAPSPLDASGKSSEPCRLAQAMLKTGGVLPLVPAQLAARFPELWGSVRAAEDWAKRTKIKSERYAPPNNIDIYRWRVSSQILKKDGQAADSERAWAYATKDKRDRDRAAAPVVGDFGSTEGWSVEPAWLKPLAESGGGLGLTLKRFHASGIHRRHPQGGWLLCWHGADVEGVLRDWFPGETIKLLD